MTDFMWRMACAHTLWSRGGLSVRLSIYWARSLHQRFGDRWSGPRAAAHQLNEWQN
jgi:hypothetical protein